MTVDIGNMRERIAFEKRASAYDQYGNIENDNWSEVSRVWSSMRVKYAREMTNPDTPTSNLSGVLTVRTFPDTLKLGDDYRVRFLGGNLKDKVFHIRGIVPLPDRRFCEISIEEWTRA